MPLKKRISWLNFPHLVIAEANSGASLFIDESDYYFYLSALRQMVRDRFLKVFAFCLTPKELRLALLPNRLRLSRIMQRIHGRHSSYMNNKWQRVGHLFRGRFQSLVFDEQDLSEVVRNIHLWPVRNGAFRRAELYPFSSHQAYLGLADGLVDFVAYKDVLNTFDGELERQRRAFDRFVEQKALEPDGYGLTAISPGIGAHKNTPHYLLEKAGVELESQSKRSSVMALAERTSLLLNISLLHILSHSRRQDLVMARRLLATAAVMGAERTITEVAHFLHRDKGQVSRLVSQGMDLLTNDEAFLQMYEALRAKGASREHY